MTDSDLPPPPLDEGHGTADDADPLAAFFPKQDAAPDPLGTAAIASLCERVAEAGGLAGVDDLVAAGTPAALIAAALTKPKDKRRAAPLLAISVAGQRLVKPSAAGWEIAGFPNKRTGGSTLSEARLRHALAPGQFCRWANTVAERINVDEATLRHSATNAPEAMTELADRLIERSWEVIQRQMTHGGRTFTKPEQAPRPDVLVMEEWGHASTHRPTQESVWGRLRRAHERETLAQTEGKPTVLRVGIEIEVSAKATPDLAAKIERLDAALDLGGLDAVVWVVDDGKIAQRLARFGVGAHQPDKGVRHYFAAASRCGIDSDGLVAIPQGRALWWAAQVAPAG